MGYSTNSVRFSPSSFFRWASLERESVSLSMKIFYEELEMMRSFIFFFNFFVPLYGAPGNQGLEARFVFYEAGLLLRTMLDETARLT